MDYLLQSILIEVHRDPLYIKPPIYLDSLRSIFLLCLPKIRTGDNNKVRGVVI